MCLTLSLKIYIYIYCLFNKYSAITQYNTTPPDVHFEKMFKNVFINNNQEATQTAPEAV